MQLNISAKSSLCACVILASTLVAGCIVVPRTTRHYDNECNVVEKHVTLEARPIESCRDNAQCGVHPEFYGLVAAGSVVVSGSVAVVGNVMYWLEKQAKCDGAGIQEPQSQPQAR